MIQEIYLLHLTISMHILLSDLYTFLKTIEGICLTIKSFLCW